MKIKRKRKLKRKPLSEFFYGECFTFHDDVMEEDVTMMVVGDKSRCNYSNLVSVLNLNTFEIEEMLDFYIYEQITVDVIELGN